MFFELFMKAIRHCIRVVLNATGGCWIEIKKEKKIHLCKHLNIAKPKC